MSEALRRAALQGRTDFVRRVLDRGAAVDAADEDGITALMNAEEDGHTDTVRLLLDRGASVDARDKNSITALMVAAYGGRAEAMRLLIERGADVRVVDDDGATALHSATFGGRSERVIDLRRPAQPYADKGHVDAVRLLLASGADVNAVDDEGKTALHWAGQNGHEVVARLLRGVGAIS